MSGVVLHDLRGPFNRVFALIQLLQSFTDTLNQDQKEYLRKKKGVIADRLGMIRNLRDYQKLESKKIDVTLKTINLHAILGVLARKKKIQWHLDMAPNLTVLADKYCLNRILDNRFSNALKFTSESKSVFVKAYENGLWIQVDVHDKAPGISPEDQTILFSKFKP